MSRKASKSDINIPQNICKLADKFRKERLEEKRKEKEAKLKRKAEKKRIEAERLRDGLEYAKKVFAWANSFRKSNVGKELMEMSHIPTAYSNIFFFDNHVKGTKWVGFVVNPRGLRLNSGGRYSSLTEKKVKSASCLAKSVDTIVLKAVCKRIDNGKVWECIEHRFNYLNEKRLM